MACRDPDQTGARYPLKVLHVIPSVSRSEGGPSYAVRAFAELARSRGVETLIATTRDRGSLGRDHRSDAECISFRRDLAPYKISFSLRRWLMRHVREFDLVHIHALFSFSSWSAAATARKHGVPYIVRPLGVLNRWGLANRRPLLKMFWLRAIEMPLLEGAAAIHYTSESEREEAGMLSNQIARLPSFIIPIPVVAPRIDSSREEFVSAFPETAGKQIVLFLARLDEKKGLDLLLEAFASAKRERPDAHLVIAGDGRPEFVAGLHQQADRYGISSKISWTGFLNESQKAAAFSAATIFVLPSYSENFGIAAAEALAAGAPSILSDQVAIAHDVDLANAAVVIPARAGELAKAIARLLSDANARNELAKRGREAAQRLFAPDRIADLLLGEYRRIVEARV